jgi:Ser/Thr protein kinase RdoA (MazF antagonist)
MAAKKQVIARGPALRARVSPHLYAALSDHYGLENGEGAQDLGGSSNLNLLITDPVDALRYVVRVYRPWVTAARLADIQIVRRHLALHGVPCTQPRPTLSGETRITIDGRLVEVEPYVEYDAKMDSWQRIEAGVPVLGRIHSFLQSLAVGAEGRPAPAAHNIEPHEAPSRALRGTRQIRLWVDATPAEVALADAADELARLVDHAQHGIDGALPRQVVHGDYWDNNVLFRDGHVVLIADLDFMGERARIDDLALTLYYTNSTFSDDPTSDERIRQLRALADAYDSGLAVPLTATERAMLPVALARTPLAFIAMIPSVDSESGARRLAMEMIPDIAWALAIVRDLARWRAGFA